METQTAYADYYSYSNVPGSPGAAMSFRKSEDIDFRDVFGGPPRRSSVHEMMRYSFTEGADSDEGRIDEMPSFRNPWTGAEEKPVFGGGGEGGNRRRLVREDFFVDIFGGSESPSSTTPRKHDRPDVFPASSPGLRALSPSWPLPPQADGFPGPTQFSLPDMLSKPVDSPALGSPARASYKDASPKGTSHLHSPKISVFGFSTRSVQVHDESRNGSTHYRPSPLSQKFSGMESPSGSVKSGMPEDLEKDKSGKQDGTSSPQFHFSIYKWASKGVPMMMPLKRSSSLSSREKRKSEIPSFDENIESKSEVSASPSANQLNVSSPINIRGTENQSISNLNSNVELRTSQSVKDEAPISRKQDKVGHERKNTVDEIPIRSTPTKQILSGLSVSNTRQTLEKEIRERLEKPSKPELKPLKVFFNDKNEEKGYNKDVTNIKTRANKMERSNNGVSTIDDGVKAVKKQDKDKPVEKSEVDEVVKNGSPRSSEDSVGRRRSKGKVKEFIKIFNQETPMTKPEATVHPQSHIFTKKEQGVSEVTKEENIRKTAATNEKVSFSQPEKPGDVLNKGVDRSRESLNGHTNNLFTERPSYNNKSGSSTDPVSDDKVTVEEADESSRTYFTIEELPQDDNKPAESTDNREEIQAIDVKIRQWSHGKEGNIRSLLSTLQYVLWPGSGWKPVPLVDIIEGPAVKRTYQRALLYLHPDKLKQKCAAVHQKYTAEKVFNILQEAWDHFNTLGSL